ncbi:unnamed protein product [Adineta steineri]|uniref:Uncharacterized protein n=2 Tax=Adineta steineri TaxID=433720 RepID=A0A819LC91_9BILA|nr:unnamed protein product [Adineta steineri]CAF3962422.1 unnamed protein product [Adineta steineri]
MATEVIKSRCITCDKEKRAVRCEGCLQLFCYDHLTDHRLELNKQLDHIELHRDRFRQTLNEQANHPQIHILIKQIEQWEEESIKTIQQTATDCRQLLIQHTTKNIQQIETSLSKLSDQLRKIRQENDFNEIDLNQFNQKLKQLSDELNKPSSMSIQQEAVPLIHKISVILSSGKFNNTPENILNTTKWKQNGATIAGGNKEGSQGNQLSYPDGIYIDDDDRKIYIADSSSHRVVKWKSGANHGQIVAGGNGWGNRIDQLNCPTDVILDKKNDSLIICDWGNKRVVRWPRKSRTNQQVIIANIDCSQLTMDSNGDLYISDYEKHEVRRWKPGDTTGTIVAGGNGKGDRLNQLNYPTYIYIDQEHSVYVSDWNNHRVMKWIRGAKEGVVVAGGQGQGSSLSQLSNPQGVVVDHLGNVYIADSWNHRIVVWLPNAAKGNIVVGGNGEGKQPNQFAYPHGLAFDRQGNLYVIDCDNHRVQKFDIDTE